MKTIIIKTIPHNEHRYDTCGDYWETDDAVEFRVSDTGNWKYELLVAFHELIEQTLTKDRGISEESITAFDKIFEEERRQGMWQDEEPGDDQRAPYQKEHILATKLEKKMAKELGVKWKDYDKAISKL